MSTLDNRRTKGAVKLAEFNRSNYTINGQFQDAVAVADSYIARHTTVEVCNLHIDPVKISPFWPKVSTTPFDAPAKMRQGYGRHLKKSYISVDAPRDSFIDPEKIVMPKNRMDDRVACVTRIPLHQDPMLPSQVLPGGLSLHQVKANTVVPHTRFRTYPHDKQTLMGKPFPPPTFAPPSPTSFPLLRAPPPLPPPTHTRRAFAHGAL